MILDREAAVPLELAFLVLSLVCAVAVLNGVASGLGSRRPPRARWRRAGLAIGLAAAVWLPAFLWVRTHTGLGVLALGGAHPWIARAAAAGDREAKDLLRAVVRSSGYGVNAAEAAVGKRSPAERERLFTLLAEVVPWPSWKKTYARRAAEARRNPGLPDRAGG